MKEIASFLHFLYYVHRHILRDMKNTTKDKSQLNTIYSALNELDKQILKIIMDLKKTRSLSLHEKGLYEHAFQYYDVLEKLEDEIKRLLQGKPGSKHASGLIQQYHFHNKQLAQTWEEFEIQVAEIDLVLEKKEKEQELRIKMEGEIISIEQYAKRLSENIIRLIGQLREKAEEKEKHPDADYRFLSNHTLPTTKALEIWETLLKKIHRHFKYELSIIRKDIEEEQEKVDDLKKQIAQFHEIFSSLDIDDLLRHDPDDDTLGELGTLPPELKNVELDNRAKLRIILHQKEEIFERLLEQMDETIKKAIR